MGSIIGYILLFIMMAFTLFNIYATATKKKSFIVKSITEMAKGFVEFLNKINETESKTTEKEKE